MKDISKLGAHNVHIELIITSTGVKGSQQGIENIENMYKV